jgi:hypothetical protein
MQSELIFLNIHLYLNQHKPSHPKIGTICYVNAKYSKAFYDEIEEQKVRIQLMLLKNLQYGSVLI